MDNAAHTPGPWVLFGDGELRQLIVMPAMRPGEIATIQFPTDQSRDAEFDANARLIAAAPDLLAKCKKVIAWLERLAAHAEQHAKDSRFPSFPSLAEAVAADAVNYRKTAADIMAVVRKAESEAP